MLIYLKDQCRLTSVLHLHPSQTSRCILENITSLKLTFISIHDRKVVIPKSTVRAHSNTVRAHSQLATTMSFCHFFLSSGVNSNIGNHATHFKTCADDIKSLCLHRQVRTGPFLKTWKRGLKYQTKDTKLILIP